MSDRYRAYGQGDDPALQEGDDTLLGVNQYDAPENLRPGQAQDATNIDFTKGDAATRGGFVCIPELGTIPFGSWAARASLSPDGAWLSVAYGNGVFVAVAENGASQVMYSTDSINWVAATAASTNQWTSVCFGGGLFVAVSATGTGNRVMTSPDGITWTSRTSAADTDWRTVAYGGGVYVAVGSSGTDRVMYSANGTAWSLATIPAPAQSSDWYGVTFGGDRFVAVARTGATRTMYSTDGSLWTMGTTASIPASTWTSVAYGNARFVAVAASGADKVMYSANGADWTAASEAASRTWNGITYGDGLYVAVAISGTDTRSMTSPDGVTWTLRTTAADNSWSNLTYGAGIFVAVGYSGSGNRVMTFDATTVWASGAYSDPNAASEQWIALVGSNAVGFYAFGKTSRSVAYPAGVTVSQQSTIVQANNLLFVFPGEGQTPLQWDGDWAGAFVTVPDTVLPSGFESVPESNQATYYQNRLWVVNGKDRIAASDVLAFSDYDEIANDFNLNTGSADYVVASYPFGDNSLVVFKNNSIILLENVQGTLADVTATEITRNLGLIGINAVTAVGPDIVYFSNRNISTIRLNLQNKLQGVSEPLSRNIDPVLARVNWDYGYKISMGYWNNLLYVALPLDDSTICNSVFVYNFITNQWYGEWNFSDELGIAIQNFVVADYLGQNRLQAITEDGRIFVTNNGQNDISGITVAEIATSLTTRAYALGNNMQAPRRVGLDLSTNRPNFSITAYSDGASESTQEVTSQTYSREDSWLWNDTPYVMDNSNDDYNRAFRKDYATGPDSVEPGTGFLPEMTQDYRFTVLTRRRGRLSWFKVANATGFIRLNGVSLEGRAGSRSSLTQVG